MQDFEGKVAVVTGAGSGIGRAMADRFAAEGMKVVLADIEEPALEAAVTELRQQEREVLGIRVDTSSYESVQDLARQTLDEFGAVHILCNNAGVGGGGQGEAIWERSLNDWNWTFGVNWWGVVYGIKTFVPIMIEQDEPAAVVNTASIAGLTGGMMDIYSITKHAVVRASEALHLQLTLRDSPVHAHVLCPGFVATRIGASSRNRPDELWDQRPSDADLEAQWAEGIERIGELGVPPAEVAEKVLTAIRDEQFYIITHDEFDDAIRTRMENILERRNPVPMVPQLQQTQRGD
jgi:NAD(P)-dependent dehydrogenase (short-subunit alcohol dehydrogenase family)